ncbi:Alpha/beta hydrolase family protein [Nocardioides dokdonensis FR1436]|uniref:Alpha/beta hydrolase family protein n=1 Tax=Nocardioides dokdonensis FR1436 TaxID=1300347 RepID=A0A1A9GQ07_9ACTN|nr:alpha/beta family hydrolase [Nocardioides dokdonensis]ANH40368.1 Alpha/beta hydrolase family protein [Nocardioides dokdonensis FR1436]
MSADEGTVVDTPHGPGRLVISRAEAEGVRLLLSHGAGAGIDTRDLEALADALPRQGVTVARFEQPWRRAGRKVASPPPTLDDGLRAAVAALGPGAPLVVGGRSAGARSAARCASEVGAVGCLALAFPLHPPGKPERSRLHELLGCGVPTLVLQGERDTMGRPEEFPDRLPDGIVLAVVPGGDHGFATLRRAEVSQEVALAVLVESTLEWLVRDVVGSDVP